MRHLVIGAPQSAHTEEYARSWERATGQAPRRLSWTALRAESAAFTPSTAASDLAVFQYTSGTTRELSNRPKLPQTLGDLEGAADDGFVLAQRQHARHRHGAVGECLHHAELALDGVRRGQ